MKHRPCDVIVVLVAALLGARRALGGLCVVHHHSVLRGRSSVALFDS